VLPDVGELIFGHANSRSDLVQFGEGGGQRDLYPVFGVVVWRHARMDDVARCTNTHNGVVTCINTARSSTLNTERHR
jgi:hypothetical protein